MGAFWKESHNPKKGGIRRPRMRRETSDDENPSPLVAGRRESPVRKGANPKIANGRGGILDSLNLGFLFKSCCHSRAFPANTVGTPGKQTASSGVCRVSSVSKEEKPQVSSVSIPASPPPVRKLHLHPPPYARHRRTK
ncbi:hypothetical protein KSP39_PZI000802 [Platanthera zijinensis]|uniref:Uncharacterized protein n=1 Tax=Platanthera zijinensis TaxID=2320716 RepID=A0AAP0GFN1_9ASPA